MSRQHRDYDSMFNIYNKEYWNNMCDCCGRVDIAPGCNNSNCEDKEIENGHCRNKFTHMAIPAIQDCEEHFKLCMYSCHEECVCQNP